MTTPSSFYRLTLNLEASAATYTRVSTSAFGSALVVLIGIDCNELRDVSNSSFGAMFLLALGSSHLLS